MPEHQRLPHHLEPLIEDRVGHLPIKPNGMGSAVAAWQSQAEEAGLTALICHVAMELGMPKRELLNATALIRRHVNHADPAVVDFDELLC